MKALIAVLSFAVPAIAVSYYLGLSPWLVASMVVIFALFSAWGITKDKYTRETSKSSRKTT